MANALVKVGDELHPLIPARGSIAAEVQAAAPRALVAAAFQHLPARHLGNLDHPIESDVLICSDHPQATKAVADLVLLVPGLRPIDAGTLAAAAPVEAFTAVLASVNIRYRARSAVRLTGLDSI
jgi:NADPH-dependent F420 reductase